MKIMMIAILASVGMFAFADNQQQVMTQLQQQINSVQQSIAPDINKAVSPLKMEDQQLTAALQTSINKLQAQIEHVQDAIAPAIAKQAEATQADIAKVQQNLAEQIAAVQKQVVALQQEMLRHHG